MKIEDARVRYNVQIKTYYSKQKELYAQKQKLEEKIKTTENGAEVYKDESAILELQYSAVDEKRQEYQDYMDKLMEQWRMISDKIASKQQSDAMADQAKEMNKIMLVARRIMHGDKVPAKDEKKLMEFDPKLYMMAKNAAAMLEELTASTQTVTAGSTEEYAAYLEEKLKKMLEAVRGLGEVEVMVTLESSEEKIVEKDMTAERSNTEEQDAAGGARTVNTSNTEYRTIYREDTGGDPFVVKTITPKVEGVLVVAEGAGKGNMAGEITQIIQALFGVEAHRIKVLEK